MIRQKKHSRSYKIKSTKQIQTPLVCIKDIVTKQVMRIPRHIANTLVERFKHMEYATKREWRYYLHDQKKKVILIHPDPYWKEKPETEKVGKDDVKDTRNYLPRIDPRDRKSILKKDKGLSRKQRREWKHRRPPRQFDMYTKHQTIIIEPEYKWKVYKLNVNVNPMVYRINKSTGELITKPNKRLNKYLKTIDLNKSIIKTDKFEIKQQVFDYDYIPKIFSSKKQPTEVTILRLDGSPAFKKIYKGKRMITVTIKQRSRTTYRTIITKQYPSVISDRRYIVKKNIEALKKHQEEQKTE